MILIMLIAQEQIIEEDEVSFILAAITAGQALDTSKCCPSIMSPQYSFAFLSRRYKAPRHSIAHSVTHSQTPGQALRDIFSFYSDNATFTMSARGFHKFSRDAQIPLKESQIDVIYTATAATSTKNSRCSRKVLSLDHFLEVCGVLALRTFGSENGQELPRCLRHFINRHILPLADDLHRQQYAPAQAEAAAAAAAAAEARDMLVDGSTRRDGAGVLQQVAATATRRLHTLDSAVSVLLSKHTQVLHRIFLRFCEAQAFVPGNGNQPQRGSGRMTFTGFHAFALHYGFFPGPVNVNELGKIWRYVINADPTGEGAVDSVGAGGFIYLLLKLAQVSFLFAADAEDIFAQTSLLLEKIDQKGGELCLVGDNRAKATVQEASSSAHESSVANVDVAALLKPDQLVALRAVFLIYCHSASRHDAETISPRGFSLLAKDAQLLDKRMTEPVVDLIYASAVGKGSNGSDVGGKSRLGLDFPGFLKACAELALRKFTRLSLEEGLWRLHTHHHGALLMAKLRERAQEKRKHQDEEEREVRLRLPLPRGHTAAEMEQYIASAAGAFEEGEEDLQAMAQRCSDKPQRQP